jgi:cupin 2 domain-containing protein
MSEPTALFDGIPAHLSAELVDVLAASGSTSIRRIVSFGHVSPAGFWYDQGTHEWVMVVSGAARLRFVDEDRSERIVAMATGDWIVIPAHVKHRVDWTTPDQPTVWLAVFYDGGGDA